ncbi:MAG: hypothetical protein ACQESW_12850 [Bacteroidota bacterium]
MKIKFLLLLTAWVCLFCSCEKEDGNNALNQEGKELRIKERYYTDNESYESKLVFSYEGEKLTHIIFYSKDENGDWIEGFKDEFIYEGNTITELGYKRNGGSLSESTSIEHIVENGVVVEEVHAYIESGTWKKKWKWTFQHSGSKLSGWQAFYSVDHNGVFKPVQKGEYTYYDGQPTEHREFEANDAGTYYPTYKEEYLYDGSSLTHAIEYEWQNSEWTRLHKTAFSYANENISGIDSYYWIDGISDWFSSGSFAYDYDEYGYLIEKAGYWETITYVYEEGNGNADLLFYIPRSGIDFEPKFKNARMRDRRIMHPDFRKF